MASEIRPRQIEDALCINIQKTPRRTIELSAVGNGVVTSWQGLREGQKAA